jgi:hypothetical protein
MVAPSEIGPLLFTLGGIGLLIWFSLTHFKQVAWFIAIILGGYAVVFVGSHIISDVVPVIQDYQLNQRCLTAHERRERAAAAPDDYFGRQLRTAAAEEARNCADLAARKEAAKITQK